MAAIRYARVTLDTGKRIILRVVSETGRFLRGIEVDREGEEIIPQGAHQRMHIIERPRITKIAEMRMNPKYATLEAVPRDQTPGQKASAHARKRAAAPEIQKLRADARLWWQIAKAEMRAGFGGSVNAMDRAIAAEKKLVALGVTPPRRPKEFAESLSEHATIRKDATAANALQWSEAAKRRSDDAYTVDDHRTAAEAHRRAARIHKANLADKDVAWLHTLAESNHRQAAKARAAERKIDPVRATRTPKAFATYQDKMAAASEHQTMASEYARQALAAARTRQ